VPERTCIVTRIAGDEDGLIRFALSPDGVVVPDLGRKLPGRGVWVGCKRALVAEAHAKGLFSRGFKAKAMADAGLADQVAGLLKAQALSSLALGRKAGVALAGNFKVEETLGKKDVRILIHAASAAQDGCRKLDRQTGPRTMICGFLDGGDLDLAFGRANVVHAAIIGGGLAEKLAIHLRRMADYDGLDLREAKSED
jgi:uncharacterized protein